MTVFTLLEKELSEINEALSKIKDFEGSAADALFKRGDQLVMFMEMEEAGNSNNGDMLVNLGFVCLGLIDNVYPDLDKELLEDFYRNWIWEDKEGTRVASWDLGNTGCVFSCEGTKEKIVELYKTMNP